ncbi:MAG: site-2 protease family protein [Thermotogota bacterium]|nr:site-2 protease family protein [Thermotogota bacterium]
MSLLDNFNLTFFLRQILVRSPAVLFALGLHEFAHAFMAVKLGDDTPVLLKRNTVNPLKHIDPIGLLCFIILSFGWSRRIPVNNLRLKNKNKDTFIIAFSGPTFSLLLAILAAFVFYGFGIHKYSWFFNPNPRNTFFILNYLSDVLGSFMFVNLIIAIFNLIPIMPLDASALWSVFMTTKHMKAVMKYQVYGILLLLILIIMGIIQAIMYPVISGFNTVFINLSGIFG